LAAGDHQIGEEPEVELAVALTPLLQLLSHMQPSMLGKRRSPQLVEIAFMAEINIGQGGESHLERRRQLLGIDAWRQSFGHSRRLMS